MRKPPYNDGLFQGPMFRIECSGNHYKPGSPHVWREDDRRWYDDQDCLTEYCDA